MAMEIYSHSIMADKSESQSRNDYGKLLKLNSSQMQKISKRVTFLF